MYSRSSAGASTPMLPTKSLDCPNHPIATDKLRALDHGRLTKLRASGMAQCNRQSGATNYSNRGGSLFLNVFIPVQALLLSSLRILRPRGSRGEHADYPHGVCGAWPRARQIRDPDSAVNRTRTQTVRVREQSMSAFSPRKQARPRTGRVLGNAADSTVRELAASTDSNCPQTVRSRELSTSPNWSRTQSVRERGLAENWPHRCISVSVLLPINFLARIQIIHAYELV